MSSYRKWWTMAFAGWLCAGVAGCEAKTVVEVVPVSEVAVSPTSVSLSVGATQQFGVSLKGSGGHALGGRTVSWSSSNASVATVSQAGLVTGVGAGTATITATSEGRSGSAAVTVPTYTLSVAKGGTGSGTVTSSPAGINCGTACQGSYASGTVVTLTATAAGGSVFAGWGGACTGTAPTCQVTMSQARSVTATFNVQMYALKVGLTGTGSGTVTSSPAGIDCGTECEADFAHGTVVTLTATARTGSTFQGWSGACTGSAGTCQVTMSEARSVTATFNVQMYTLTVTRAGTGSGTVTSSPSGINCGTACQANYASGTVVTLTATAASGSVFTGWSGACTGTASTCQVTMSQARSVVATFDLVSVTYTLTVTKTGTGSGTVTSSPTGINCGSTCSASFTEGTLVTLTATAASGSVFTGWSGACTGTASTCQVTMSQARSVTATFTLLTTGTVSGTVSAEGTGLSGVSVTLTGASQRSTVTGANGTYTITSVVAGNYQVSINASNHPDVSFSETSKNTSITSQGQTSVVDFSGSYIRTARVTGTVSVSGQPLGGASVTLKGGPDNVSLGAIANAMGQYTFFNLRAGTYTVSVSMIGYSFSPQSVTISTGEIRTVNFQG